MNYLRFFTLLFLLLSNGNSLAKVSSAGFKYPYLNQVYQKLAQGDSVTIAFLGGSITYGAFENSARNESHSFRALLTQHIRQTYLRAKLTSIDGAIGATGSGVGMWRVKRDIIKYKPHLTFVEFVVNDDFGGERSMESMESIIRQLKSSNHDMAIVVILLGVSHRQELGWSSDTWQYHRDLAVHYGLPYVNMVAGVNALISLGKADINKMFPQRSWGRDHIHPKEDGHLIYKNVIVSALDSLKNVKGESIINSEPITKNRFINLKMVELKPLLKSGGWESAIKTKGHLADQDPRKSFNSVIQPSRVGAVLPLGQHSCSSFGLYYESMPKSDQLLVYNQKGDTLVVQRDPKYGEDVPSAPRANFTFASTADSSQYFLKALTNNRVKAAYFLCGE